MVSQYGIYVNDAVLDSLSPPILQVVIRSQFSESLGKKFNFRRYLTATQRIVIGIQIRESKAKEYLKLHLLRI